MSNNADTTLPMATPPLSSTPDARPQETQIRQGAFDPPLVPGTLGKLERFDILRLLGEGGMGQVYLAREPRTDTDVAVKIMKPSAAGDPQAVHRFLTEAQHMYRLSHPRILRVLEVSERKEGPYYVMPYIEGGTLAGQYKPGQPLPEERMLSVARQVAEALAHAHSHGLIHRDLKPGNVLLDNEGNAYLTDFGLVRTVFNDSMVDPSSSHLEGTAPYMSPAVARGEAEDTRCDIYAFGALLYELITGQPPYAARTPQIILDQVLKGPPKPIREITPKANPALVRIAEGCMARELRDRYASMFDVVTDFDRVVKGLAPFGPHRRQPRLPRIVGIAAGLVVIVGLAWTAVRFSPALRAIRPAASDVECAESPVLVPEPSFEPPVEPATPARWDAPFGYTTNNGAITITRYTGTNGVVELPAMIGGLSVDAVGDQAFQQCAALSSVRFPASVTHIGGHAFEHCTNLAVVVFPPDSKLTHIGDWAFHHCLRLSDFPFPKGTAAIGARAFSCCFGFTRVEIPVGVSSIGPHAFHNCGYIAAFHVDDANPAYSSTDGVLFDKPMKTLLRYPSDRKGSYAIPPGVTRVESWAFYACDGLPRLMVPASVTDIICPSFGSCPNLSAVMVDPGNPFYSSLDGVLFDKEKSCLLFYPGGGADAYEIPAGVRTVGVSAFADCVCLRRVTLPASVASIKPVAFLRCENLMELHFQGRPPILGSEAFEECGQAVVCYPSGQPGWGTTFGGRPTAEWKP